MTLHDVPLVALGAANALPDGAGIPEWIHLLPAGRVETYDGRGPYTAADLAAIVAASMDYKARIVVDENHATDLAAKQGLPAPAKGYIVAMEARADGIWAQVDWTAAGRALLADRAYWGISPVFHHTKDGRVVRILRAALTNDPALRGLTALSSETEASMVDMKKLARALDLAEDADEDAILAAIARMKEKSAETMPAETLAELGRIFGVEGEATAVLAAAKLAKASGGAAQDLATQLAAVRTELDALKSAALRAASEAYVDQALREGRAGVNAGNRDELVALHMEHPAVVEKLIGAAPRLAGDLARRAAAPPPKAGEVALTEEQLAVAAALGIAAKDYATTLAAERNGETA